MSCYFSSFLLLQKIQIIHFKFQHAGILKFIFSTLITYLPIYLPTHCCGKRKAKHCLKILPSYFCFFIDWVVLFTLGIYWWFKMIQVPKIAYWSFNSFIATNDRSNLALKCVKCDVLVQNMHDPHSGKQQWLMHLCKPLLLMHCL